MESERETRKRRIDPHLKAAGWTIVPYSPTLRLPVNDNLAIEEYPTANGPADYAFSINAEIVGVVEAKKVTLGPQNVLTQSQRYARGLIGTRFSFDGHYVPFLYSTNGEVFWFHDVRHQRSRSRRVSGFHTPDALAELLKRELDSACNWLETHLNQDPKLWPFQVEANQAIENAIADRKRQMLVAMATGTGKTFTLVNQVYRLMKSGLAQRIRVRTSSLSDED